MGVEMAPGHREIACQGREAQVSRAQRHSSISLMATPTQLKSVAILNLHLSWPRFLFKCHLRLLALIATKKTLSSQHGYQNSETLTTADYNPPSLTATLRYHVITYGILFTWLAQHIILVLARPDTGCRCALDVCTGCRWPAAGETISTTVTTYNVVAL